MAHTVTAAAGHLAPALLAPVLFLAHRLETLGGLTEGRVHGALDTQRGDAPHGMSRGKPKVRP